MAPQLHTFTFCDSDDLEHLRAFIALNYAGAWAQAVAYAMAREGAAIVQITSDGYKDVRDVAIEDTDVSFVEAMEKIAAFAGG
jgi:hypothetical protein